MRPSGCLQQSCAEVCSGLSHRQHAAHSNASTSSFLYSTTTSFSTSPLVHVTIDISSPASPSRLSTRPASPPASPSHDHAAPLSLPASTSLTLERYWPLIAVTLASIYLIPLVPFVAPGLFLIHIRHQHDKVDADALSSGTRAQSSADERWMRSRERVRRRSLRAPVPWL